MTRDEMNAYLESLAVGDEILVPVGSDGHPLADVYLEGIHFSYGPTRSVGSFSVVEVSEDEFITAHGEVEWSWDRRLDEGKWSAVEKNLDLYIQLPEEELSDDFQED